MRYGIFFLTLFFAISGIQAYMNHKNLTASISDVKENIRSMKENNAYIQQFYLAYLASEYAPYFYGHENGLLYQDEQAIRFTHRLQAPQERLTLPKQEETPLHLTSPKASREHFLYTIILRNFK
jgi:hypothetical protein